MPRQFPSPNHPTPFVRLRPVGSSASAAFGRAGQAPAPMSRLPKLLTSRTRNMTGTDHAPRPIATIGFIGLGVMGEAMCGHLARRSGRVVLAHDLRPDPLQRLASFKVTPAATAEIAARADLILLSLPDGRAVQAVLAELEPRFRPGQCVVDTSTSPVALTREIGARLAAK